MFVMGETKEKIRALAEKHDLALVVLFGSQATGKTHSRSDVDIGYSARGEFDFKTLFLLETDLERLLGRPDVELVNLKRISPIMKYIISREGKLLYERSPGLFVLFKVYAYKLYVETKSLRTARYESLKKFIYGRS